MDALKPKEEVRFPDEQCPKCGSNLLFNGEVYWCSFVGGYHSKGCDYGILDNIDKKELERDRIAKERLI